MECQQSANCCWAFLIYRRRQSQGRTEDAFAFWQAVPIPLPRAKRFLVRSRKNPVIQSGWMDGAASTVHMLHHSVLFPNGMQIRPGRVAALGFSGKWSAFKVFKVVGGLLFFCICSTFFGGQNSLRETS